MESFSRNFCDRLTAVNAEMTFQCFLVVNLYYLQITSEKFPDPEDRANRGLKRPQVFTIVWPNQLHLKRNSFKKLFDIRKLKTDDE